VSGDYDLFDAEALESVLHAREQTVCRALKGRLEAAMHFDALCVVRSCSTSDGRWTKEATHCQQLGGSARYLRRRGRILRRSAMKD
jgi:hypothetical protein